LRPRAQPRTHPTSSARAASAAASASSRVVAAARAARAACTAVAAPDDDDAAAAADDDDDDANDDAADADDDGGREEAEEKEEAEVCGVANRLISGPTSRRNSSSQSPLPPSPTDSLASSCTQPREVGARTREHGGNSSGSFDGEESRLPV